MACKLTECKKTILKDYLKVKKVIDILDWWKTQLNILDR